MIRPLMGLSFPGCCPNLFFLQIRYRSYPRSNFDRISRELDREIRAKEREEREKAKGNVCDEQQTSQQQSRKGVSSLCRPSCRRFKTLLVATPVEASAPEDDDDLRLVRGGPVARRRGAIKQGKVVQQFRGHKFVAKFFRQPSFCSFCQGFLW